MPRPMGDLDQAYNINLPDTGGNALAADDPPPDNAMKEVYNIDIYSRVPDSLEPEPVPALGMRVLSLR